MKILLADDHEVVRRGLKQMLSEEFGDIVFGEAGSAAETLARLREAPGICSCSTSTCPDAAAWMC
jgi:DNA-binding NarL/FixJ family response regulator